MAASWKVTAQRETMALDPFTQQFARMVEVTFVTGDGTVGKVTVPVDQYNADTVREKIDAYVEHIDAVANLEGGRP